MKKFSLSFVGALITLSFVLVPNQATASAAIIETLTASASSAVANRTAAITFTFRSQRYRCSKQYIPPAPNEPFYKYPNDDPGECSHVTSGYSTTPQDLSPAVLVPNVGWQYTASVSGSGNVLSASKVTTDGNGYATFTLKSSAAQAKTVTITEEVKGTFVVATKAVTFTAAVAPAKTSTPAPSTPASTPAPPPAPILGTVKIGTHAVDAAKPITLDQSKPLVLSGTTVPNGVILFTIHSTPKAVTTTADKDGKWSYTISGLTPGNHSIEANVTDPVTHQTSSPVTLLTFKVAATKTPAATSSTPATPSPVQLALIATGALLLLIGAWYSWKRWQKQKTAKKPTAPSDEPTVPPPAPAA